MKPKNRFLMISMTMALLMAQSAFCDGGATSGGGNGTAAEIQRATNEFIAMVEANPEKFPGVDPQILKSVDPEIRVTGKPIEFCDQGGTLDAYSDLEKSQSTFNLGAWMKKNWREKVLLAGHERLVLAKYEKSNRYPLSNKIYEVEQANEEKKIGAAKAICDFGSAACRDSKEIEQVIGNIVSSLAEDLGSSPGTARILLDMTENTIETEILMLIGIKQIEIQRRWINFGDSKKELANYERQVRLAFENHFRPLFLEVDRLIEQKTSEPKCVQVSGAQVNVLSLSVSPRDGVVDVNRAVASVMSPESQSVSQGVTGNAGKSLEEPAHIIESNSGYMSGSAK